MKKWLLFIIVPITAIYILEAIVSFILGFVFLQRPDSFAGLIGNFFIYFTAGALLYNLSPSKGNVTLPIIASFLYVGSSLYFVATGAYPLLISVEITRLSGFILAIFGAHKNYIDNTLLNKKA